MTCTDVKHAQTNTQQPPALPSLEGEWIADILRVWNAEAIVWDAHLPAVIRLESTDLVIWRDSQNALEWQTGIADEILRERTSPVTEGSASLEKDECAEQCAYSLVRYSALSQTIGTQIEHAKSTKEAIELTLSDGFILKAFTTVDGALDLRIAPLCETPETGDAPMPCLPKARR